MNQHSLPNTVHTIIAWTRNTWNLFFINRWYL